MIIKRLKKRRKKHMGNYCFQAKTVGFPFGRLVELGRSPRLRVLTRDAPDIR
jgi:hypothetical protein